MEVRRKAPKPPRPDVHQQKVRTGTAMDEKEELIAYRVSEFTNGIFERSGIGSNLSGRKHFYSRPQQDVIYPGFDGDERSYSRKRGDNDRDTTIEIMERDGTKCHYRCTGWKYGSIGFAGKYKKNGEG